MLKKSEVLKEGYKNGIRKAVEIVESMLLKENPLITQEMHDNHVSAYDVEKLLKNYVREFREKIFDWLKDVIQDPVGHDIEVAFTPIDWINRYCFKVDDIVMMLFYKPKLRGTSSWQFYIPPDSVEKFITKYAKRLYKDCKEDLLLSFAIDKIPNQEFGKAIKNAVSVFIETIHEMDYEFFQEQFIEEMKDYGAATESEGSVLEFRKSTGFANVGFMEFERDSNCMAKVKGSEGDFMRLSRDLRNAIFEERKKG